MNFQNRPIKFRAWHKKENKMYYNIQNLYDGNIYDSENDKFINADIFWSSHFGELSEIPFEKDFERDEVFIMQFTGLRDKNGKEIYEGDVVIQEGYPWFDNESPNYIGVVKWIFSAWQVIIRCINPKKSGISDGINEFLNDEGLEDGEKSKWQIIGNIFENPELVKE